MNEPTSLRKDGADPDGPGRSYLYRHVVSLEETNVVGNVYYARHVAWQGRCREMFLRDYVPQILDDLAADLRLVTLKVSCEYYEELRAFDEVQIAMRLAHQHAHRLGLSFDYVLFRGVNQILVARGFQEIACMRTSADGLVPAVLPRALVVVLDEYKSAPNGLRQYIHMDNVKS